MTIESPRKSTLPHGCMSKPIKQKPPTTTSTASCLPTYFSYATSHIESETECHCSQSYGTTQHSRTHFFSSFHLVRRLVVRIGKSMIFQGLRCLVSDASVFKLKSKLNELKFQWF